MVVSGTIAPSRELPELSAEETIRIILSNLNLIVPVVAALLVIIIAIVVICVLRSKGNHHKGTPALMHCLFFSLSLLLRSVRDATLHRIIPKSPYHHSHDDADRLLMTSAMFDVAADCWTRSIVFRCLLTTNLVTF